MFIVQRYYRGFVICRNNDTGFFEVSITTNHQTVSFEYLLSAKGYIDKIADIYDKYTKEKQSS